MTEVSFTPPHSPILKKDCSDQEIEKVKSDLTDEKSLELVVIQKEKDENDYVPFDGEEMRKRIDDLPGNDFEEREYQLDSPPAARRQCVNLVRYVFLLATVCLLSTGIGVLESQLGIKSSSPSDHVLSLLQNATSSWNFSTLS